MTFMNLASAMFMLILALAPLGAASAQTTNGAPPQENPNASGRLTTITGVAYGYIRSDPDCYYCIPMRVVTLFRNSDGQEKTLEFRMVSTPQPDRTILVGCTLPYFSLPCAVFQSDYSTNALTQQATQALRQLPEREQLREAMLKFQEWAATAHREHVTSFSKTLLDLPSHGGFQGEISFDVDAMGNASFRSGHDQGGLIESLFCLDLLDSDSHTLEHAANSLAKHVRKEIAEENAKQNLFK